MVLVAFGSHNAPCLYGSECLTLNYRCQAGFCLCVDGFFFKQGLKVLRLPSQSLTLSPSKKSIFV